MIRRRTTPTASQGPDHEQDRDRGLFQGAVIGRRSLASAAGVGIIAAGVAACSNEDPLAKDSESAKGGDSSASDGGGKSGAIVVGSQQYYSNEIIAELFAQALESAGAKVERQYQIGQREVYVPELKKGSLDVMPEYLGNLLQYLDEKAAKGTAEDLAEGLSSALPDGLRALPYAKATDQDSYSTTQEFASQNSLKEIGDLAGQKDLKIAANPEFEERPYGPKGAKSQYDVDISVVPVSDSGGPLTLKALMDGKVQIADIYTADPSIVKNDLVVLEDPKVMVLPENVVPIVSEKVDDKGAAAIKKVTDALTTEELIKLNTRSVDDKTDSKTIAKDWLEKKKLLK
ncbi:glycine/betaine ABC transporter [Brachybacterium endophyticum]|uniref:Glycine/betaine ABC transporter n=1 Tax=Brachybacterium endophyticum TaxID=2182385 RepID=A0A2U2RK02_9MICO|nr:ABC transporter substrate-binding protein [Brachybacterium endophyticum]PWH06193.1 glycine/betaine ABC transporter [Brachybacterium endophyticum]